MTGTTVADRATGQAVFSRWPFYPVAIAAAIVLVLFTDSTAAVAALPRPLLVVCIITLALQLVGSLVTRSRHAGAFISVLAVLALAGLPGLAVALLGVPFALIAAAFILRRVVPTLPWSQATQLLNAVAAILLALTLGTTWQAGALVPPPGPPAGEAAPDAGERPDVYLILLDAYPRADTLQNDFGFDNGPFLAEMEALGFDTARASRSNYNTTNLTLASMLNMARLDSIEAIADPPPQVRAQYRLVTRVISEARGLDEFRRRGYEVVTVPPAFSDVTLHSADRIVDNGGLTDFEFSVLQSGLLRVVVPDAIGGWMLDSSRSRVLDALESTVSLARERGGPPKLALTHVLSPHEPNVFGADGSPRNGWPCFPRECSIFDGGQRYGDGVIEPTIGQVEYLNRLIVETSREIIASSEEPPVILVFSDHGHRHLSDDPYESIKTLLLAFTPGQTDLFPPNATPVNYLARILYAYHEASFELESEESYIIDLERTEVDGLFGLELVPGEP